MCYHCDQKGHRIEDCYKRKNEEKKNEIEMAVDEDNLVLSLLMSDKKEKEKS